MVAVEVLSPRTVKDDLDPQATRLHPAPDDAGGDLRLPGRAPARPCGAAPAAASTTRWSKGSTPSWRCPRSGSGSRWPRSTRTPRWRGRRRADGEAGPDARPRGGAGMTTWPALEIRPGACARRGFPAPPPDGRRGPGDPRADDRAGAAAPGSARSTRWPRPGAGPQGARRAAPVVRHRQLRARHIQTAPPPPPPPHRYQQPPRRPHRPQPASDRRPRRARPAPARRS